MMSPNSPSPATGDRPINVPKPSEGSGSGSGSGSAPLRRLASIDAFRGFVMFLLLAEWLRLPEVAKAFPKSEFWALLSRHQQHVEWVGCSLHDLIQPAFSFLVGVALPFSIASRLARGQSTTRMAGHAFWRALVLVLLGIFLRSMGKDRTNFTFEDTLTQIGLGYGFLFLLGLRPARDQWIAVVVILVGYWGAFALYPAPGTDFDYTKVDVPQNWSHHLSGFASHWNKNSNLAWAFDTWFLNLFPRKTPFLDNRGGYATLSFIPTLATMIFGLLAGGVLKDDRKAWIKLGWLTAAGILGLFLGAALGELDFCPVVKRIWTPSWTLFSAGWCFLILAAFYAVVDMAGLWWLTYPLIIIGTNSIAAYCLHWLVEDFITANLKTHLGPEIFAAFGPAYEPLVQGAAALGVVWLILFWMYRRKLFIKI
jgi:heparan-alpha-glucosaminide N-acetyltransferase